MGVPRALAVVAALPFVAAACGAADRPVGQGGTTLSQPATTAPVVATSTAATAPTTSPITQAVTTLRQNVTPPTSRAATVPAPILGTWVQDDAGSVLTYQRRFEFRPDGTYRFLFTSRPTGSLNEQILTAESGRYAVNGERLSLSPSSGPPSQLGWRVDTDAIVGDLRLSLTFPDGAVGVYYRAS